MDRTSIIAVACALAMDAFAVAVVSGLTLSPVTGRQVFRLAFHFGLFQALMPVIGWVAGNAVYKYIAPVDHWVAFGLLGFVGGRMIWGSLHNGKEKKSLDDPTSGWKLVVLSVATSIDALAVGLSLALIGSPIIIPAIIIGLVAAAFTVTGMFLGRWISSSWGRRVEALGGAILVAMGIKILTEHLLA
jgi:putative Mn2+ efflux pump MntP